MDLPQQERKTSRWSDMEAGEDEEQFFNHGISTVTSGNSGDTPINSPCISRVSSELCVSRSNSSERIKSNKYYPNPKSIIKLRDDAININNKCVFMMRVDGFNDTSLKNILIDNGINVLTAWCLPDSSPNKHSRPYGYAILKHAEHAKILIEGTKKIKNPFLECTTYIEFKIPELLKAKEGQNPNQVRVKGTATQDILTSLLEHFDTELSYFIPINPKSNVSFILTFSNTLSATLAVKRLKYYRKENVVLDAELGFRLSV